MEKHILAFKNRNNEELVGIVHEPENKTSGPNASVVILANTGIHYRVAWHRINKYLAERLCKNGYWVFRFDPHGIGDSQGELEDTQEIIELYDIIQSGLFVDDTLAAIDVIKERFGISLVYLAGFCGGALSSILAGGVDQRVNGVAFMAGPVTVSTEVEMKRMHPLYAKKLVGEYLRKALSLKSWVRLVQGKSDYKLMKQAISSTIKENEIRDELLIGEGGKREGDLFNRRFLQAFDALAQRNVETLFLMAEVDHATYQFEQYFLKKILKPQKARYEGRYQFHVIQGANHTFTSEQNQSELFDRLLLWLDQRRHNARLRQTSARVG